MRTSDAKVLLLVGHALYEPWRSILLNGQLETWARDEELQIRHCHAMPVSNFLRKIDSKFWNLKWDKRFGKIAIVIEVLTKSPFGMFVGNLKETKLYGTSHNALLLKIPDLDFLMNYKSFAVITGILKFDFDFVVLTTSSSYLNLDLLNKEISKLPKKNTVAGRILEQNGIKFASGSFKVFSRDVVESIQEHKKMYSKWRPDDLAYGFQLKKIRPGINYIQLRSIDADSESMIESLTDSDLHSIVHYRLKSGTQAKRNDVALMQLLHKRLNG
jgi:hypothetical protein